MRWASAATSPTGNSDSSNSENCPAALRRDAAITGTRPLAMPSITLTDSRSAMDGCTNRSPDRSSSGISVLRWKPISTCPGSRRSAVRCSRLFNGPVPAIVSRMEEACRHIAAARISVIWSFSLLRRPEATIWNGVGAGTPAAR